VPVNTHDLPVATARDKDGGEVCVSVRLPERDVKVRVWRARAGHIDLVLLDTDIEPNDVVDRAITHQIYTSDVVTRLQQAMVLGIGGVRALDAIGLMPTVWHINEGLPALQIVERCRRYVSQGLDFASALEIVAASTVFTTHTPVPAGHEVIDTGHLVHYMGDAVAELGIDMERFLDLGRGDQDHRFNFTTLCLRGSRFHNGVSRIHGRVASEIEKDIWPEVPTDENPLTYVTNGVHVQTFLAMEWAEAFADPDWPRQLLHPEYWERIDHIPDDVYWRIHRSLKAKLLAEVRWRLRAQSRHRGCSEAEITHQLRRLDGAENALVLGFARRFATYKRATLLFSDMDRLERLLGDPDRPVIIIIAGKAHQADEPGQHLIGEIHRYSELPAFRGKVILLEGYDLALARSMIRGVDVWLNLPEYPLEACGTSGQKAGINGVLNLSVLDGWWPEGFNGDNGWAIEPHHMETDAAERNRREANELFELLEEEVVPLYFTDKGELPSRWVRMSKASMKSLLPRFNSERMVVDYIDKFYGASCANRRKLVDDDFGGARELSAWKEKVAECWKTVAMSPLTTPPDSIGKEEELELRVAVHLGRMAPEDVIVECLLGRKPRDATFEEVACYPLATGGITENGEVVFQTNFAPPLSGLQYYTIRIYPYHRLLSHPFELGLMKWL
jgi:starch phosphorylase